MANKTESLSQFYKNKFDIEPEDLNVEDGFFNVFRIEDWIHAGATSPAYIRRDFYKIMLFRGDNCFHFGDKSVTVTGDTLLFFNPLVPYTSEPLTPDTNGYFCIFKDEFFESNHRLKLKDFDLFNTRTRPVYKLNKKALEEFSRLFEKMLSEKHSEFKYRYELIRNYLGELIYQALKLEPATISVSATDASARITSVFYELLDRQFPIESIHQRFEFRSPKSVADKLSVHVNYLNRAIKKATGKTTSELIFERIVSEAKALLKHTDWNISEIGYALGFGDQAQFNNFFKQQTQQSPSSFRQV
ncbi:MAG: helix-turn-helix transcriptional regulator [Flavitalea sp.]